MTFRFVVAQSLLFWLETCDLCLNIPQGLYYVSANSKGSGETALMRRFASLLVAYVISTQDIICKTFMSFFVLLISCGSGIYTSSKH